MKLKNDDDHPTLTLHNTVLRRRRRRFGAGIMILSSHHATWMDADSGRKERHGLVARDTTHDDTGSVAVIAAAAETAPAGTVNACATACVGMRCRLLLLLLLLQTAIQEPDCLLQLGVCSDHAVICSCDVLRTAQEHCVESAPCRGGLLMMRLLRCLSQAKGSDCDNYYFCRSTL